MLHMIAKQIPYRYPNIKFIVPHLGGPIQDGRGERDPCLAEPRHLVAHHPAPALGQRLAVREEGRGVAVRPHPEQHQIEDRGQPVARTPNTRASSAW